MPPPRSNRTSPLASGLLAFVVAGICGPVAAHEVGESYVFLSFLDDAIEGRLEARLADLGAALPLDTDGDGSVSVAEFDAARATVVAYFEERFTILSGTEPCPIQWTGSGVIEADLGKFANLTFRTVRPRDTALLIEYTALFDVIPGHRGLVIVEYDSVTGDRNEAEVASLVFSARRTRQTFDPTVGHQLGGFPIFVREGLWHIWIGLDHVLFLVALILPSVLVRRDGSWEAVSGFRPALIHVVKVVTLFTLAHSVTLSLAALGIVQPPMRWVESVIAASVVVAAVNGAFLGRKIWPVIFLFGLFHGFGFAAVLGHLSVDRRFLVPTLIGFNVGVEIGQVAILGAVFPGLWLLRRWKHYPRIILQLGSGLIGALAFVWLLERALDVTILGVF